MLSEQTAYGVLWWEKHFTDEVITKGSACSGYLPLNEFDPPSVKPLLLHAKAHTHHCGHAKKHPRNPLRYYSAKLQQTVPFDFPLRSRTPEHVMEGDDPAALLYNISE